MVQDLIKFSGTNEKLFTRMVVEKVTPKTTLIVPETHNAIIMKDGEMLQTLSKGKYKLNELLDVEKDEELVLEIIYVSKTAKLKLLWGTPNKITIEDPVLGETYKMGMSGDFEVQVSDPRKCFLYLVGAEDVLTAEGLQDRLMSKVVSTVEDVLVSFIDKNDVTFSSVYLFKQEISNIVVPKLSSIFSSQYGITVYSFNIANIIFDDKDLERLNKALISKSKKIVCSACGVELDANAKFCSNCGKKIGGSRICPNCHAENVAEAKFCAMCGGKL